MPDPKEWISRIKGVDPPELWRDVQRRAESSPARSAHRTRPSRMAATITGVVVGVLALLIALRAFDQPPITESPPSPAPKVNGMVAFLRTDPRSTIREGGDPRTALFVVGPDGRGVQRLIPGVDHYRPPAWSPDGSRIAYVRDGDLYTIHIEDREESLLLACEPPACQRFGPAAWSPQGTRIAFGQQGPQGNGLWVSDADGTGARLLRDRIFSGVPTWSPDERFLAVSGYVGDEGDRQNEGIFVIDAETGALVRTIPLPGLDSGFTVGWSPNGGWLVFDAIGEGGVDYGVPTAEAGAGIYLIREDGTDQRLLTSATCESNTCLDLNPSWSPDGREIVFTRSLPEPGSDGSVGDLYVIGVESGDARQLTSGPGLDCCASWQPLPAGSVPSVTPDTAVCADDSDRRNAPPVDDVREVSVYFSCEADAVLLGTDGQPVYMFTRSVPDGSGEPLDRRLEAALGAYLAGPTPDEVELGYFTPAPPSLGAAIQEISISDGIATVDFDSARLEDLGSLGTSTASSTFLIELRAVALQFPELQQLVLRVDGDCDSFWHMLEMSCQTIRRVDVCPVAPFTVSRLPWLREGSEVPAPELIEEGVGAILVWFQDPNERWSGRYVALKRSTMPLGEGLSDFPTLRVRGVNGRLVWIGDPGVGELALTWNEGDQLCRWYTLSISSVGLTQREAEVVIQEVAASLS